MEPQVLQDHGGTIGLIIAVILFSIFTTRRTPFWTYDRLVIAIALVGALIRIGNLMNHEIYGHPTDLPWGFRFITNLGPWMAGVQEPDLPAAIPSYSDLRSALLHLPIRSAHVDVLEEKCRRTPCA